MVGKERETERERDKDRQTEMKGVGGTLKMFCVNLRCSENKEKVVYVQGCVRKINDD